MTTINYFRRKLPAGNDDELARFIRACPSHLTVDHIIPKHYGGQTDLGNLQWLTKRRNEKKGCAFHWRHPKLPTCQPIDVIHLPEDYYASCDRH